MVASRCGGPESLFLHSSNQPMKQRQQQEHRETGNTIGVCVCACVCVCICVCRSLFCALVQLTDCPYFFARSHAVYGTFEPLYFMALNTKLNSRYQLK